MALHSDAVLRVAAKESPASAKPTGTGHPLSDFCAKESGAGHPPPVSAPKAQSDAFIKPAQPLFSRRWCGHLDADAKMTIWIAFPVFKVRLVSDAFLVFALAYGEDRLI